MALSLSQLDVVEAALSQVPHSGIVEVVGPWGSGKTLVAAQVAQARGASLLYITAGRIESEAAHEDLATFTDPNQCVLLPAWEVLPTDAMAPADDVVAERMHALNAMARAMDQGEPVFASVSVRSFLQRVVNHDRLVRDTVHLEVGDEYDLEAILKRLSKMGYERELMVEQRGHMSVRGGIFDVFPISGELPFRVEFFGDEVESIRRFEPETQRSVEQVEHVQILPRSEKKLLSEQAQAPGTLSAVTDYLSENTVVAIDEPLAVLEEAERLEGLFADTPYMESWDACVKGLKKFRQLSLAQVAHDAAPGATRLTSPMRSMAAWAGNAEGFWEQLEEWDRDGYTVQLFCNNTGERRRLLELLEERGYKPGRGAFDLRIGIGRLHAGFVSPNDTLAVLSEHEIFGRKYVRRVRRRFQAGAAITAFSDVAPGDYIVHMTHGVGRYLGLRRFEGKVGDFLSIQYAGGDIMYVPVSHIDHVQKYVGGGGAVPKIDKLGGTTWTRKKALVKKSVQDMTEELLKLYAARATHRGQAFSKDTHWQDEFEDAFEYEETPDQDRAITDVKQDMESAKPMDRLLCGDVGFGKTEVALRAAFKAVMERKQVAILVPTTVLAEQHYLTFKERLADYPVSVEMLSRFRTPAEIRDIIRRLREGEVDIVVGTHRLTSGDVQFKDLGLVILDEEQRFGVKHKERLKKLKIDVDLLTLTATPIPRTLHFSMMGVRDMSVINTAPNDRLPIHTCIEVFDEHLIAEAIQRELGREGQVFYLHNRVQTIERVAEMVKKLVPQARVAIAHGQMNEHELEAAMAAFVRNEFDVLVCTTIIGSGLDIPNANTIIVDRADRFGLSELYQLRGRIGRYKHRAFAYLLVPGDKALTEAAQKRLNALQEFSTLGSGFRVAMRDLEIRGCGNILGAQQSGHIATVGYETYTQLIEETVAELTDKPVKVHVLPPFDVSVEASIPEDYIPLQSQKVTTYKRISGIRHLDDVDVMLEELKDRFGEPPEPVRRLIEIMAVRALGADVGATRLRSAKGVLSVELQGAHMLGGRTREELAERFGNRVKFSLDGETKVALTPREDEDFVDLAKNVLMVLADS